MVGACDELVDEPDEEPVEDTEDWAPLVGSEPSEPQAESTQAARQSASNRRTIVDHSIDIQ